MAEPKPMPIFAPVESSRGLLLLLVMTGIVAVVVLLTVALSVFVGVVVLLVAVPLDCSASNVQLFDQDDAKFAIGRDPILVSLGPMDCIFGDGTSGPGA